MICLTLVNRLQFGHLTLMRFKKRIVKSKNPQMIPKKRVSRMRVSMVLSRHKFLSGGAWTLHHLRIDLITCCP
jgi:hypothetical protein